MYRSLALVSVAALSMSLAGCHKKAAPEPASDSSAMNATTADTSTDNATAADGNMADANMSASAAPAAAPMTGQAFANAAAASDAFEIASSKLAETKGKSKDVKSFAAEMIKDHTESTAKIKKAAAAASPAIKPDPTLSTGQQAMLAALGKLSGDDFDKQFATDQVDGHHMALAAMQGYAASGDVPSLKAAAGEIAPIVSGHLDMAKKLP